MSPVATKAPDSFHLKLEESPGSFQLAVPSALLRQPRGCNSRSSTGAFRGRQISVLCTLSTSPVPPASVVTFPSRDSPPIFPGRRKPSTATKDFPETLTLQAEGFGQLRCSMEGLEALNVQSKEAPGSLSSTPAPPGAQSPGLCCILDSVHLGLLLFSTVATGGWPGVSSISFPFLYFN